MADKPGKIKIRAKLKDGVTTVKAILSHPMETGARKDKETGELIPEHYIQEVTAKHNDTVVFSAHFGTGISKDPYISFKFSGGAAGDPVTIEWKDNLGVTNSGETKIKG